MNAAEPTNNTCKLTDDELIARVLELEKGNDTPEMTEELSRYEALVMEEVRRDSMSLAAARHGMQQGRILAEGNALRRMAPDLARRLQKANERIEDLEERNGYGWDRKLADTEAHKCKCGNSAYLFCKKEYNGDELIFSYFVACPNCMAHYPKLPDSYIGSTGETVALEEWNESFED